MHCFVFFLSLSLPVLNAKSDLIRLMNNKLSNYVCDFDFFFYKNKRWRFDFFSYIVLNLICIERQAMLIRTVFVHV